MKFVFCDWQYMTGCDLKISVDTLWAVWEQFYKDVWCNVTHICQENIKNLSFLQKRLFVYVRAGCSFLLGSLMSIGESAFFVQENLNLLCLFFLGGKSGIFFLYI